MNRIALSIGVALATLVTAHAFAQSGETGASGSKAAPKPSVEEKAAAKAARKEAGTAASKETAGRGEAGTQPGGSQVKVSRDERKAAAVKRKSAAVEARKKGELQPTGEGASTK